jgi:hypothetical protein
MSQLSSSASGSRPGAALLTLRAARLDAVVLAARQPSTASWNAPVALDVHCLGVPGGRQAWIVAGAHHRHRGPRRRAGRDREPREQQSPGATAT